MVRDTASKIARHGAIFNKIKKYVINNSTRNISDSCWEDYMREEIIRRQNVKIFNKILISVSV